MPDYRKMFDDKEHLYAMDLDGRERTLEIERVVAGELTGEKNRKSKKPIVSFVGEKKKLAINKTNGKTIAALYGKDTDDWAGELITIYPTTTEFGGETVDCIRVRPKRPERGDRERRAPQERSGKNASRQSKAVERDAADASQIAARYLIGEYEKCDGSDGLGEDKMAELKVTRGQSWPTMTDADREAVGAAAFAAKARIDAAAKLNGAPASGGGPAAMSDEEAAAIARDEATRRE